MKKLVVVSGLSGAGKSQVINILEDNDYFCVDNLPVKLFDKFVQLVKTTHKNKFAVSMDVRSVEHIQELVKVYTYTLEKIKGVKLTKLFLEADEKILVNRFSETRRKHPLGGELVSSIKKEQKLLSDIKKRSDFVIDTTKLTIAELRQKVISLVEQKKYAGKLRINIVSFSYRLGIPLNADFVFDTRFLPNPNYVTNLKMYTGKNIKVKSYVLNSPVTIQFVSYIKQLLKFLLPKIQQEGKNYFTICFGCTGGRHRSVVVAEEIYKYLKKFKKDNKNYILSLIHRDI
jgi:UPF0042 nucleotide-binding protein